MSEHHVLVEQVVTNVSDLNNFEERAKQILGYERSSASSFYGGNYAGFRSHQLLALRRSGGPVEGMAMAVFLAPDLVVQSVVCEGVLRVWLDKVFPVLPPGEAEVPRRGQEEEEEGTVKRARRH